MQCPPFVQNDKNAIDKKFKKEITTFLNLFSIFFFSFFIFAQKEDIATMMLVLGDIAQIESLQIIANCLIVREE